MPEPRKMERLVIDALTTNGGHHKQWYLIRIAGELSIPIPEGIERGIEP